jgi:chitin disaccharide deacetylase
VERLACPPDAKLLIVHADDLGITHSVNAATVKAFQTGLVNSGSVMVPCPWFPEIADYAKSHADADLGIHLTLTSERRSCRWGPVSSKDKVRSLLDQDGYFHLTWTKNTLVKLEHVARELRAQIEKALAMGVRPTHLDSHELILYSNGKDFFDLLVRLGREYRLPVSVSKDWFSKWPYLARSSGSNTVAVDHEVDIRPHVASEAWSDFYTQAVMNLRPGITELIIHPGYDDEELRAFSSDREAWGSAWRQRDFDFFTSSTFRDLLRQYDIAQVTWRDLGRVAFGQAK